MSRFNVTADGASPLLVFSPGWQDTRSNLEKATSEASLPHRSANCTVQFHGTSIWIFGSWNGGQVSYSTSLDAGELLLHTQIRSLNTSSGSSLLFSATGLANEEHTLVIATDVSDNGIAPFVIDSAVWQAELEEPSAEVLSGEANGSGGFDKALLDTGSSASISFEGHAIHLFGSIDISGGAYSVSVDDRPFRAYQVTRQSLQTAPPLLYFASNLGAGNHRLTVRNEGPSPLNITHSVIAPRDDPRTALFSEPGLSREPPSEFQVLPTEAVVGIVTSAFVLFLLAFLTWCIRKRRRELREERIRITREKVRAASANGWIGYDGPPQLLSDDPPQKKQATPVRRKQSVVSTKSRSSFMTASTTTHCDFSPMEPYPYDPEDDVPPVPALPAFPVTASSAPLLPRLRRNSDATLNAMPLTPITSTPRTVYRPPPLRDIRRRESDDNLPALPLTPTPRSPFPATPHDLQPPLSPRSFSQPPVSPGSARDRFSYQPPLSPRHQNFEYRLTLNLPIASPLPWQTQFRRQTFGPPPKTPPRTAEGNGRSG